MERTGRNDLCPCGSGKKYKRCCLDKDKEEARSAAEQPMTIERIRDIIDNEMEWDNEQYRMTALHFLSRVNPDYGADTILTTVMFWQDFANTSLPIIQKPGAFGAALDYFASMDTKFAITQSEAAKRFGVSSATVSKRYNELMDFAEMQLNWDEDAFEDEEYDDDLGNDDLDESSDSFSRRTGLPNMTLAQIMNEMKQILGDYQFKTKDEAKEFVNEFMLSKMEGRPAPALPSSASLEPNRSTAAAVASPRTSGNSSKAQELLFEAMEETSPVKRISLAKKALKLYPNCPDAYLILAQESRTPEEAAEFLHQGIEAGERDLGEGFFRENEGYFWGLTETRPYMRVKFDLADICWKHGDVQEAREHLEHLLRLDPGDSLGARYLLLAVYLYEDQLELAELLLAQYDEASSFFMYDRVVLEYKKRGISAKLKMDYRGALHTNPHVPKLLLGEREMPDEPPEYYGHGDENEAVEYVVSHARLWLELPQLLQWMSKHK